ncbi:hypothetical protein scyTo_0006528 [Scyliorhinus torazame]|uniref:Uncharacterized protein n=1 Tax=Scyliorhinus torazame TaxID=75743 RepID=A0A401PIF1_SCYTO|nr:hypothetical protein [Scyliorhinus torazame]
MFDKDSLTQFGCVYAVIVESLLLYRYQLGQKNSIQGLTEFQVYFNHSLTPIKLLCHILKENQCILLFCCFV